MYQQLEVISIGIAMAIDTILLLMFLERANRNNRAIWLLILIGATWSVHATGFVHVLTRGSPTTWLHQVDQLAVILMAAALLIMPSAMLHAAIRVNHTGHMLRQKADLRYGLLYLPLLALPWIIREILAHDELVIPECFGRAVAAYVIELSLVNLLASYLFLRYRSTILGESARRFFLWLATGLILIAVITAAHLLTNQLAIPHALFGYLTIIVPSGLAILFLWYTTRERIVPLVFERALLYGAMLVLLLFLHQVFFVPIAESWQQRSQLDIMMLEGIVLLAIVLSIRPLRERALESLRYLIGHHVFRVRAALRGLSLELAQQNATSISELEAWFKQRVSESLQVSPVAIWYASSSPHELLTITRQGALDSSDGEVLERVLEAMEKQRRFDGMPGEFDDSALADCLIDKKWEHLFRFQFKDLKGLVLLGENMRHERYSDEQRSAMSMLFDQYAATLSHRLGEQQRLHWERKASQQEKMAVLGLMASSLAHEIKNPLSSIRTIATLMTEDLAGNPTQSKDVRIILDEIDRLHQTTQRMLDYARPPKDDTLGVRPFDTVMRIMHVLAPWAQQQQVTLQQEHSDQDAVVPTTDADLSEILFNLLRNAIEAAKDAPQATVWLTTGIDQSVWKATIRDNGPGIDPLIHSSLYQPFVTGKEGGTGLGLYLVAERVRVMRGKIECSTSSEGTSFQVHLPLHPMKED